MRPSLLFCALFLLAGCASQKREPDAEARAYERGYRQALKEQYWIIQNQQRTATAAPNPKTP
ncbi:MAG: hypothetical protein KA257_00235 [Opitutaceae bacterium]|nr:hypothetical protein [Opitutaceae bacterium]